MDKSPASFTIERCQLPVPKSCFLEKGKGGSDSEPHLACTLSEQVLVSIALSPPCFGRSGNAPLARFHCLTACCSLRTQLGRDATGTDESPAQQVPGKKDLMVSLNCLDIAYGTRDTKSVINIRGGSNTFSQSCQGARSS